MDSEREKFRTYIEKAGVVSVLTNLLVGLYEEPERPSNPLEYIRRSLGCSSVDVDRIHILEEKNKELEMENKSLREQLHKLQASGEIQKTTEDRAS